MVAPPIFTPNVPGGKFGDPNLLNAGNNYGYAGYDPTQWQLPAGPSAPGGGSSLPSASDIGGLSLAGGIAAKSLFGGATPAAGATAAPAATSSLPAAAGSSMGEAGLGGAGVAGSEGAAGAAGAETTAGAAATAGGATAAGALGGFGLGAAGGELLGTAIGGQAKAQDAGYGSMSGAAAGAAIGSVVPGLGTVLGGVIGGLFGGALGGKLKDGGPVRGYAAGGKPFVPFRHGNTVQHNFRRNPARTALPGNSASSLPGPSGLRPGMPYVGRVVGPGTGQSDSVPIMASNDEHVISAPEVAKLGGGSSSAGHQILEKWRAHLRASAPGAAVGSLPGLR